MITSKDIANAAGVLGASLNEQDAINRNLQARITNLETKVAALGKSPATTPTDKPDARKFIAVPADQWNAAAVAKRIDTLGTNAKVLKEGVAMLQLFTTDGRLAPVGNTEMLPGVVSSVVLNKLTAMAAEAENALQTCLAIRSGLAEAGLL